MSRKSLLYGYPLIPAGTIPSPSDGDYTSPVIEVSLHDNIGIHYKITDSSAGSQILSVQVQNGDNDSWHRLEFSNATFGGDGAGLPIANGDYTIVIKNAPFTKLRMNVAGPFDGTTLTMEAWITSKSIGA